MAADFNLTNQYISASFKQLVQISGSIPVDGTGSAITNLDVTASHAVSASYAVTTETRLTSSYADVAALALNSDLLDGKDSSAFATTGSNVFKGNQTISGSVTMVNSGSDQSRLIVKGAGGGIPTIVAGNFDESDDPLFYQNSGIQVNGDISVAGDTSNFRIITNTVSGSLNRKGLVFTDSNSGLVSAGYTKNGFLIGSESRDDIGGGFGNAYVALTGKNSVLGNNMTTDYGLKYQYGTFPGTSEDVIVVDTVGQKMKSTLPFSSSNSISASAFKGDGANITGVISASHAVQADNALTANSATTATTASNANYATSASRAISAASADTATSATTATSASHAVQADSSLTAISSSHAVASDTSISASHAVKADLADDANDLIINVKNTSGSPITKGQVLHATGVTGENINVELADNTAAASMPGFAIANQAISTNATGQAIVSGRIVGINTAGLTAGDNVYVNSSGGFTGTKPTGSALIQNIGVVGKVNASDGELVVLGSGRSNDLPNIAENNLWLGDANGVPQAVASSSIIPTTANTASYVAAANIDGTVATATSSSHAINSDTSISASHAVQADNATSASIANKLPDNATVNIAALNATGNVSASSFIGDGSGLTNIGSVSSSYAVSASHAVQSNNATTAVSASHAVQADNALTATSSSHAVQANSSLTATTATSASHAIIADSALTANTATSASFATTASFALNTNVDSGSWDGQFTGSANITGSLDVEGNTTITGSLVVSGSTFLSDGDGRINMTGNAVFQEKPIITSPGYTKTTGAGAGNTYNINQMVYQNYPFGQGFYEDSWMISQWDSTGFNFGMDMLMGATRINANVIASGSQPSAQRNAAFSVLDNGSFTYDGNSVARYYGTTMELGLFNSRDIIIGNTITTNAGYGTRTLGMSAKNMYLGATAETVYDEWETGNKTYSGNEETHDINLYYTGSVNFLQSGSSTQPSVVVTGQANFGDVIKLAQQDPLPTGGVGELAVSSSNLYFHNGTSWSQIN